MRRILRASEGRPQHEHVEQHQQNIAEEGERKGNALEVEFDGTISTGNAPRQFFRKIPQRRKPAIPKVVVFDGPRGAPERAPISASLGPDVVRLLERSGAFARDDSGGREALEGYSRLRSRVGGTDIGGDHGGFGADPFGEMEDDDVDEEDRRDEQLQRLALDVCVVGEPNAGKSTLVNAMVGDQVSAVSPRAQTTRSEVLGVKTFMDYGAVELGDPEFLSRGPVTPFESGVAVQVVFRDTPGVVDPAARKKFSRSVVQAPYLALEELAELTAEDDDPEIRAQKLELYGKKALDEEIPSWQRTFVCLVVDAGRAEPTVREKHVVSELVKLQQKDPRLRVLCVLNKSDLVLHRCSGDRDAALDELKRRQRDIEESGLWLTETFSLSAKKQTGLRDLADYLRLKAVPAFNNEWEYEDPSITCGSSQVERVEDAVREQLFHHLEREVPYAVVQRNRQWVEMPPPSEILFIEQELLVSKGAQARMIVGKGGEKISEIRERANATILEFMGRPVELKLTVKVVSSSERQQTQLARDEV